MHISELRIRHFRNFMSARLIFQKGVNTLIGENGSGKTNALYSLRLLLDESLSRNSLNLRESDFCRSIGQWRGHWIIISVDFSDLDSSEGCQILRHNTAHMDESNNGNCTLFFRPKVEIRKKLFELSGEREQVENYLVELSLDDYETVITGRSSGNFLDDAIYNGSAGDFTLFNFPDPESDNNEILGVPIRTIHNEVACTFVRALRDVISELGSYRGNPLLTLLRGMESSIKIEDAQRIIDKVADLNSDISSLDEIDDIANGIEETLQNAVGNTYAPGVSIESALPDSMEKLLKRLNILVGDNPNSDYRGELYEQSLGSANLIYLALKLLEFEYKLSTDRVAHFLLIEEPEAHIHTHIQKTLFSNLPESSTQVIVSTHSTHISSASKVTSVNILAKNNDYADVYQPAQGLSRESINHVERYLDAIRSTILFAKGVVLVEGDAEQIMIPAMLRSVFGVTPDELGFSVISMGSAFFHHIAVLFHTDRIQRNCSIITDQDKSLIELPEDPDDDTSLQSHARNSQEAGDNRKENLEILAKDNPWIQIFYADFTFEVDFVLAGNSYEVVETLDDIFIQPRAKNRSQEKIESKKDSESGLEVLRLAKKIGKGWFSLLLSERFTCETFIPDYILKAIAFACYDGVGESIMTKIAKFRMENNGLEKEQTDVLIPLLDHDDIDMSTFLKEYRGIAPDDMLTLFCNYIEEYIGSD